MFSFVPESYPLGHPSYGLLMVTMFYQLIRVTAHCPMIDHAVQTSVRDLDSFQLCVDLVPAPPSSRVKLRVGSVCNLE